MPAMGERIHVNREKSSRRSWHSLEVSPRRNSGQGKCGGKDQVRQTGAVFCCIFSKKKNIKSEVPKNAMHLLNHAYINALCEIIIHSQTEEEVKLNTRIVSKFFYDGWEKLRGF